MDEEIKGLYQIIFRVSKHFLEQFNMFTIEELAEHNEPTYDSIAEHAKRLAEIITVFAEHSDWSGERIALNAKQAALYMEQMALAITEDNNADLNRAAKSLNAMDFI